MHILTLFSPVPSPRLSQTLNILAGLSATQPRETYQRIAIYAPLRPATDSNLISKKKTNASQTPAQLSLVQLVHEVKREDFVKDAGRANGAKGDGEDIAMDDTNGGSVMGEAWTVRTQEIPEPETKNVVLRKVEEEEITGSEVGRFEDGEKFRFVNEYFTEGFRFVYRDTVLHLYRVLVAQPEEGNMGMRKKLPALEEMTLLDGSGAFVLEATVRVEDRSKPALVQTATEQLLALRNELKGAIDLRVPERLSMDTRLRG
ncbi:Med18-like protein [Elsinoe fawcettii]|nr:Med18-like protein [Elsinoe fawcettii]